MDAIGFETNEQKIDTDNESSIVDDNDDDRCLSDHACADVTIVLFFYCYHCGTFGRRSCATVVS